MNKRIEELAYQAEDYADSIVDQGGEFHPAYTRKFAELLVRDCINTIENRAPGQMGNEGEGWTNGYDDGLKTGAFLIKQHFGVEE